LLRQEKQQRNGGSKDRQGGSDGALFNSKGSGGASQIDGVARMAALQTLHKAYAVTGAVFLRAAAKVEVL
jgi:hypothetical protein